MSQPLRILLHGVTGRMGRDRHIKGALAALQRDGYRLELTLAGRDAERVKNLAEEIGAQFSPDLPSALANERFDLFFDAANPVMRPELLSLALHHGVAIFGEKPLSLNSSSLVNLLSVAREQNLYGAVVQDKLFTPGYLALQKAISENLLGEIYDINGDFGYWIETGASGKPINRPSWNFQKALGGSLIQDLFSHWNYIIEIVDSVAEVSAISKTHVTKRIDENNQEFTVDIPDIAHVIFSTDSGITGRISSSWIQRPLIPFTTRITGSAGTAIATPSSCILYSSLGEVDLISNFGIQVQDEFFLQWKTLIDAMLNKQSVNFDLSSALRQSYFCESIIQSASSGLRLPVNKEIS